MTSKYEHIPDVELFDYWEKKQELRLVDEQIELAIELIERDIEREYAIYLLGSNLSIQPDNHVAWCYLSMMLNDRLGCPYLASIAANEAVKLKPGYAMALYYKDVANQSMMNRENNRNKLLSKRSEHKSVVSDATKPLSVLASEFAAKLINSGQQYEYALKLLDTALANNPHEPGAWLHLAKLLIDHYECSCLARLASEKAVAFNPGNAKSLYYMSCCLDDEEAIKVLDEALVIDPEYEEAVRRKKTILYMLDRENEARACRR